MLDIFTQNTTIVARAILHPTADGRVGPYSNGPCRSTITEPVAECCSVGSPGILIGQAGPTPEGCERFSGLRRCQ